MSENKEITVKEIQDRLAEPFPEDRLEWRVQSGNCTGDRPWAMIVPFVSNRAIQQRLDDVVGCFGWRNSYHAGPLGGVICTITIKEVPKSDGADNTEIEAVKGGLSDSMKRAAVHWGIGRYLYKLKTAYAEIVDKGGRYKTYIDKNHKDKKFQWNPPMLPDWALPEAEQDPEEWAYKHPKIVTIARDNGLSKAVIREAVLGARFKEDKCIEYLNQLMEKAI